MAIYRKFRKTVSKARKGIRAVAKAYLKGKRTYIGKLLSRKVKRNYGFSSTAVAKQMANLNRRMNSGLEWKTLDQNHTSGSPDVTLRQFFRVQASALESTASTTTTPGVSGYLNRGVNLPSKGTGTDQYDGQKFSIENLQWKGTLALESTSAGADAYVRMYLVAHKDAVDQPFVMSEFLEPDNHGEYSTMSRRNRNHYKDYQVCFSRTMKLCFANKQRVDFNYSIPLRQQMRHQDGLVTTFDKRFYCIIVCSPDIANKITSVDYSGMTRMRFIH